MNGTKRITATALIVVSLAASCLAQDPPQKSWVWLTKQGVWGYGYQIDEGPNRGLWRIDPDSKRAPEDIVPSTDPYGFTAILNQHRAPPAWPPWYTITTYPPGPHRTTSCSPKKASATTSPRIAFKTVPGTLPTPPVRPTSGCTRAGTGQTCSHLQQLTSGLLTDRVRIGQ